MALTVTRVPFSRRPAFLANGQSIDITAVAQSLRISEHSTRLLLAEMADTRYQATSFYGAYRALSNRSAIERRTAQ
ncbi:hypothetical protein LMG33810_002854 [Carnimonas sp. LMG 33810]